ncbi:VASH1 isoform 5 [Pan troglodytes]|uniref:Vasohibin 1 n=2 Tax=Homininae TaxID=207598 RepID=G3V4N9_HUMAN|nr:vasohibin 1 [Homo sapiens]KAI4061776.1 vasohibin 1 [Homo sapiens]PNI84402.1 VASH1 isoform 5 [Pan troglodytes]
MGPGEGNCWFCWCLCPWLLSGSWVHLISGKSPSLTRPVMGGGGGVEMFLQFCLPWQNLDPGKGKQGRSPSEKGLCSPLTRSLAQATSAPRA